MFKNMKIEITDDEHLKAVCDVLESMGFIMNSQNFSKSDKYLVVARSYKCYLFETTSDRFVFDSYDADIVTLTDLLKMRDEIVKDKARLNSKQN